MKTKKFQKRKENFTCQNCGLFVEGGGYRNHCPKCLWSKHVDINPGDRQSDCRGIMEPMGLVTKKGEKAIIHKCQKCGLKKRNKQADDDNYEAILKLSSRPVDG